MESLRVRYRKKLFPGNRRFYNLARRWDQQINQVFLSSSLCCVYTNQSIKKKNLLLQFAVIQSKTEEGWKNHFHQSLHLSECCFRVKQHFG